MILLASTVRADDWPQWLGPQRDGVWRETGIVETFPAGGPVVRWRVAIGAGYAGPVVAGERVLVMDRVGAADTPKSVGVAGIGKRYDTVGHERVLCFEASTGKTLWKHEYVRRYDIAYPSGPRATPVVDAGKVFALGAMGDLYCLDAKQGQVLWSKNFVRDCAARLPLYGFAASPIVDGHRLICMVGGADGVVAAFDKNSGSLLWQAITAKAPGSCTPVIIKAGGRRQLIVWHTEALVSLDPENGKTFWSEPFEVGYEMAIATPQFDGRRLFISSFHGGSMLLELSPETPGARVIWKNNIPSPGGGKSTLGLHCTIGNPVLQGEMIYGVCASGELRGVKADTGERLWATLAATGGKRNLWASAYLIPHADRYFIFNERGDLSIAHLTPAGYEETSRAHILAPSDHLPGRAVTWAHPAFADRCVYARSDSQLVCVSLAVTDKQPKP